MLIEKPRIPVRHVLLFGLWPGFIKRLLYRLKGYRIGKKVHLGLGSAIIGKDVSIGDYTSIGFFSIIRGKSVRLGPHVQIGSTTFLDTPHIEIGEGSKINEQVFVGGLQFPDSRFVMGKNCQIMQMSFINPARSIVIGDDTGIGGHSLIFGHTSWLSQFEGYPVEFSPIEIGKSVSLAWRVFVLPGTKIGDGAVVGANSLVYRTIPPRCLAIGFPARVVNRAPEFPKDVSREEKVQILESIVDQMAEVLQQEGIPCRKVENDLLEFRQERRGLLGRQRTWKLLVGTAQTHPAALSNGSIRPHVYLSLWSIPPELRRALNRLSIMWIDIEQKEQSAFWNDFGEEVVLFLRRYGVRFCHVQE